MIKLKNILNEAKWDNIAGRVWDYVISNEVKLTEDKLKDMSDRVARISKINKANFYEAVKRIGEEKNWFTKFIMHKGKGGAGVFK